MPGHTFNADAPAFVPAASASPPAQPSPAAEEQVWSTFLLRADNLAANDTPLSPTYSATQPMAVTGTRNLALLARREKVDGPFDLDEVESGDAQFLLAALAPPLLLARRGNTYSVRFHCRTAAGIARMWALHACACSPVAASEEGTLAFLAQLNAALGAFEIASVDLKGLRGQLRAVQSFLADQGDEVTQPVAVSPRRVTVRG